MTCTVFFFTSAHLSNKQLSAATSDDFCEEEILTMKATIIPAYRHVELDQRWSKVGLALTTLAQL